jgi:hypothetical protein
MGIWKNSLDEANTAPVQGQSIQYTDRDSIPQTPQQLELPFTQQPIKTTKTKYELKREADELFENFNTVLHGRDVSIQHKQTILTTLLNGYKLGTPDHANRSKALLLDLFTELLGGI